jgi:predicted transposase YdaD
MHTNDLLWKGIIEELAEDFLTFLIPNANEVFDFQKGIEFLDKELEQLFPESADNRRHVDKLLKVFTKEGKEEWILGHVEVQGYRDVKFSERMFIYYYRIFDKFGKRIVGIAIFTDNDKNYKPYEYKSDFLGTEISYKYLNYKVIEQDLEVIQSSQNPFATVIETVYIALQKGNMDEETLYELKLDLAKRMLRQNFPKSKIRAMMLFLKYYIRFDNKEKNLNFEADLDKFTNTTFPMGLEELIIWQAKNEGLEQGLEQGLELAHKNSITKMLNKGYTITEIAENLDISVDEAISIINKYKLS